MSEQTVELIAPLAGAEYAIPWPAPLPGVDTLTFRGHGDGRTETFELPRDASVRILADGGPFGLRVLRPDGSDAVSPARLPGGGLGLGQLAEPGTYALEVCAPGQWAVTIAFFAVTASSPRR